MNLNITTTMNTRKRSAAFPLERPVAPMLEFGGQRIVAQGEFLEGALRSFQTGYSPELETHLEPLHRMVPKKRRLHYEVHGGPTCVSDAFEAKKHIPDAQLDTSPRGPEPIIGAKAAVVTGKTIPTPREKVSWLRYDDTVANTIPTVHGVQLSRSEARASQIPPPGTGTFRYSDDRSHHPYWYHVR